MTPGDEDARERPPRGHVLRRREAAVPHSWQAEEEGLDQPVRHCPHRPAGLSSTYSAVLPFQSFMTSGNKRGILQVLFTQNAVLPFQSFFRTSDDKRTI